MRRAAGRFDPLYLFFAVNYLAQGLIGIAYEPLSYVLKDGLGLSAGQSAAFVSAMTLPFLLKPLLGLLSDDLATRGVRRITQIEIAGILAAVSWLGASTWSTAGYWPLLALMVLANVGLASADVSCDAVMVREGKAVGRTGPYQAAQVGTLYLTLVATGLGGGYLAKHAPPAVVFALTGLVSLLILISTTWAKEERRAARPAAELESLKAWAARPATWALAAIIFLWSFNPLLGTAMFYYQADGLRLDPVFIGGLSTLAGAAGVLGAGFFGRFAVTRWKGGAMLQAAVLLGGPLTLLYLFYRGPASAAVLSAFFGFVGVVFRLSIMDLAAKACPAHAEASAFAAMMAMFNLSAWSSNALGGALYDRLVIAFAQTPDPAWAAAAILALIGCACTLACWPLLKAAAPARSDAR